MVMAHGGVGAVSAGLAGNDVGAGFLGGAFGKLTTVGTAGWSAGAQGVAAVISGGIGSALGGGKFKHGAVTAAFGYLFNQMSNKQRDDIWNRKAVRGTTKRYKLDGGPYQGVYSEGEWQTYKADSNVDPTDLIPANAVRNGVVLTIKALTITTEQMREVIRGDIQDYNVVEYDSVFDLVNGERVNEQIYYGSGRAIDTERIHTNQNVTRSIEFRTCYLGTIGC